MNRLNYNYVVFNSQDGATWKDFPDGYYNICVEELKGVDGIKVVTAPVDYLCKPIRFAYSIYCSPSLARKVQLPFKEKWFPFYFKDDFQNDKPKCFVIINKHLPLAYLKYLKKRYKNCKIVVLYRDLLKVSQRYNPGIQNNPDVDLYMTFDKGESERYGMPYFSEFESLINIPISNEFESDLYFAGNVKDRLPILLDIYHRVSSFGLRCKYYLTGVSQSQRVELPGIEYAEKFMTYREMLIHTARSKCVLEINQQGADGYTSRFLEAVMFNRKLITNNDFVKLSPFYKPEYIQLINNAEDISETFLKSDVIVDYHYNGEFSPLRMIERVEEELIKKYGK